jgi:hypothetical protein
LRGQRTGQALEAHADADIEHPWVRARVPAATLNLQHRNVRFVFSAKGVPELLEASFFQRCSMKFGCERSAQRPTRVLACRVPSYIVVGPRRPWFILSNWANVEDFRAKSSRAQLLRRNINQVRR